MAILSRSELLGVTAEQIGQHIDALSEQLKLYPGFIAHASGAIPGGYQVIEVWETQEAQERWIREALGPVLMPSLLRMGVRQPTVLQVLSLDHLITR
ncbi:MAG TPA: hypothetical protein VGN32_05340 [Ktedonobacterales bacterium]|jgi:hypothetical protein|nr:hypothetical protein [Ktedonobacterales bacterium]